MPLAITRPRPSSLARLAALLVFACCAAWPRAAAAGRGREEAHVRRGARMFAEHERADVQKLSRALDDLVSDPAFVEPFRARDREKLLAAAAPRFAKLRAEQQITHWYFLDPEPARTCFLRVHAPALHGDVVERHTLSQAIATHGLGAGKELGKTAFALRVVKPIRVDGKVIGYMELGEEIDHFLERMKADTGDDFGVLAGKEHVDRAELARVRGEDRWDERPDVVLVTSTVWDENRVEIGVPLSKLPAEGRIVGEWSEAGRGYVGGAFPIHDSANRVVGALFVRRAVKPRRAPRRRGRGRRKLRG